MLTDVNIKRDKDYFFLWRIVLKLRKKIGRSNRERLNKIIKEELKNENFTIFSNNCLGGVFYHDAGKQFTSPLINTALDGPDFIKFLKRPDYYLNFPMKFIDGSKYGHNYPIALIDDIEVRFVHYKTKEEAELKWRIRSKRIIWDNIFVIATNHDGLNTNTLLEEFNKLDYDNKIMFVSKDFSKYRWAIFVPQFKNRFQVRIMTDFADFKGHRYYETVFDIPAWIKKTKNKKVIK